MSKAKDLLAALEVFHPREEDNNTVEDMVDFKNIKVSDDDKNYFLEIPMTDMNWSVSNIEDLSDYFNSLGYVAALPQGIGMVIKLSIPKDNPNLIEQAKKDFKISIS
ncbi:MAG: hypothetical protein DRG78_09395 [Epsilonproteobacteria bacterium]|nr:MAG: hypothetical protein DRG78_09395 [Campylobacterota bacterium]